MADDALDLEDEVFEFKAAQDAQRQRDVYLLGLFERVTQMIATERIQANHAHSASEHLPAESRIAFREGAAWQRKQERGTEHDLYRNVVLNDLIEYALERQQMQNPKGWAHVLRVVEGAPLGAYNSMGATQQQLDEAIKTIEQWAELEKKNSQ